MQKLILFTLFALIFSAAECKQVLVAGGAGFLGSHLCERLLEEGNDVICLDNFSTGNVHNIAHLQDHPRFTLILHDIIDPFDPEGPLDEIYNLACPAAPDHYKKRPLHTLLTCVMGTRNLLELAKKYDATFFQASTSEIYGDPMEHPQKESYWGNVNPIGQRACYDEGKRCAETFCFEYHRQQGVKIKVARIFNTYGPRMNEKDGRIVSNFVVQALKGDPLTVYGDGSQTRSLCYVSDLIDAICLLMKTSDDFLGPINLGNPTESTVLEWAERIIHLTKSSSSIVFMPLPSDDPKKRKPDITLAKNVLNWCPKVTPEEGLKYTVAYFEQQNSEVRIQNSEE